MMANRPCGICSRPRERVNGHRPGVEMALDANRRRSRGPATTNRVGDSPQRRRQQNAPPSTAPAPVSSSTGRHVTGPYETSSGSRQVDPYRTDSLRSPTMPIGAAHRSHAQRRRRRSRRRPPQHAHGRRGAAGSTNNALFISGSCRTHTNPRSQDGSEHRKSRSPEFCGASTPASVPPSGPSRTDLRVPRGPGGVSRAPSWAERHGGR